MIATFLLIKVNYALRPYLLTSDINPQTAEERRYNRKHASTRCIVERTIGAWKRRFRAMHGENRMSPERVCTIVAATMVLHNVARDLQLPDFDDEDYVPDDVEVLHDVFNGPVAAEARVVRDLISQAL